jgi:hypothetical protein
MAGILFFGKPSSTTDRVVQNLALPQCDTDIFGRSPIFRYTCTSTDPEGYDGVDSI